MDLIAQLKHALHLDRRTARARAHFAICQSKIYFLTKQDAKRHCKLMIQRGASPLVHPYRCPCCKGFHVTRNKQK